MGHLIKAIILPKLSIELLEVNNSEYVIKYSNSINVGVNYSETIKDYKIASELFDMKFDELEGI